MAVKLFGFICCISFIYGICHGEPRTALSPMDPSSFSRPDIAIIKHISLQYNVDFDQKILHSVAVLNFEILKPTDELILDAKDLSIDSIELEGKQLNYTVTDNIPNFGAKLTVRIPKLVHSYPKVVIKVKYTTSPNASALQWLNPNQTSGKKYSYLFSQCGPIHARSILPCQDTPAVKFTYEAEVVAPGQYTALMSALRQEPKNNRTAFSQPVPIPSYLLALAVGVLEHRRLGPRSLVWAEIQMIEPCAWEFAETEKYLQAAEALCGPYQWSQYDLLVLPPSFPYGGMENPCLTFVTPTLLSEDRSQAHVIIHEIVHSWSGNLVSIKNFEHFWLKEGFTVLIERKVAASLELDKEEGQKIKDFKSIQGLIELKATIDKLGKNNPLTSLVVNLNGVHPDDSFSAVPYTKGPLFLEYIEELVGGPAVFNEFIKSYLNNFQRQSIDTDQFKNYLLDYFKNCNCTLLDINWNKWLYSSGMPPAIPNYDLSLTKRVNKLVTEIINSTDWIGKPGPNLTSHQLIYLLQKLVNSPPLSVDKLRALYSAYRLNNSNDAEIYFRWLRLRIRSKDQESLDDVFEFVSSIGRLRYVQPIYRDLYAWEEMRQLAIDNFLKNEPFMMHVTAYKVRKELHLNNASEEENY